MNVKDLRISLRGVPDTYQVLVRVFDLADDLDFIGTPYQAGSDIGCLTAKGAGFFAIDCMPEDESSTEETRADLAEAEARCTLCHPPRHLHVVK